mmetsp:Transcript_2724/g.6114  ORF Transcript_2724/g.6114 Transcript_2724/m.6114 type:complete len:323 (-) Transcript_2724:8-976(-)
MRPILMKGHERPLTFVKYNSDGDLLFSMAKDHNPTIWRADDGTRLGVYKGHNGAVFTCDVTHDSARLVTGSADQTVRLWDVRTGEELHRWSYREPARSVDFGEGEKLLAATTDPFMGEPSKILVYRLDDDPAKLDSEPVMSLTGPEGRITRAVWGPLNNTIVSVGEDGMLRKWDAETGKVLHETQAHEKSIVCLQPSYDGTCFITGSHDKTAKLFDFYSLEELKTYTHEKPVLSAFVSPLLDHVVLAGGQDASQVTLTSSKAGGFESKIVHKVYNTEVIGTVRGHFGPVNAIAYSPDGRSFVTGGEDGYVRLNHMDAEYFAL